MADGIQSRLPAQKPCLPLLCSESLHLREILLGSTASGLHDQDTPSGLTVVTSWSIVLRSKIIIEVTEYRRMELLDGVLFVI